MKQHDKQFIDGFIHQIFSEVCCSIAPPETIKKNLMKIVENKKTTEDNFPHSLIKEISLCAPKMEKIFEHYKWYLKENIDYSSMELKNEMHKIAKVIAENEQNYAKGLQESYSKIANPIDREEIIISDYCFYFTAITTLEKLIDPIYCNPTVKEIVSNANPDDVCLALQQEIEGHAQGVIDTIKVAA